MNCSGQFFTLSIDHKFVCIIYKLDIMKNEHFNDGTIIIDQNSVN
jgi:hypothetical protein